MVHSARGEIRRVSLTLTSITVSLAFVPLWLGAAPDLLDVRHRLTTAAASAQIVSIEIYDPAPSVAAGSC
jgi:hypothetical protein